MKVIQKVADIVFWSCVIALVLLAFAGCKTQQSIVEVPVPMVTRDTVRIVVERTDSIHVQDSVVVRGDTVDRWHTKYVLKVLHDTLWRHHVDTVSKPIRVTEVKEVAKRGPLEKAGYVALALVVVWAGIRFRRLWQR